MCGIVGIVGRDDAALTILDSLKRLEYRGYDSAGIATLVKGRIERRRAPGKLAGLDKVLRETPLPGSTGRYRIASGLGCRDWCRWFSRSVQNSRSLPGYGHDRQSDRSDQQQARRARR